MLINFSYYTLLVFVILVSFWLISVKIVMKRLYGYFKIKNIFFTFFGYVWLGFFTDIILRFILFNLAPETYRATAFPMWNIPDVVFMYTFGMIALFWITFSFFYFLIVKSRVTFFPNIVRKLELDPSKEVFKILDFLPVLSLCATFIISGLFPFQIPKSIFTPIGYLTSLYLVSSIYIWYWYFTGVHKDGRRFFYLIPGIVYYLLNPYRENFLMVFMPIIINFLFLKKDIKITKYAIGFIIVFLFVTAFNYSYREVVWSNENSQQSEYFNYYNWESQPTTTPWATAFNRFHSLDSFLLTVYMVPSIYPHTNRYIVDDLLFQALIPTVLSGGLKSDIGTKRGSEFAETIWSYSGETKISARIAPSMYGDLFRANGIIMVLIGAMLWGIIVGLFENYRIILNENAFLVMISIYGLRFFGSIERDFVFAAANIIQFFIVMILVLIFFPKKPYNNYQK